MHRDRFHRWYWILCAVIWESQARERNNADQCWSSSWMDWVFGIWHTQKCGERVNLSLKSKDDFLCHLFFYSVWAYWFFPNGIKIDMIRSNFFWIKQEGQIRCDVFANIHYHSQHAFKPTLFLIITICMYWSNTGASVDQNSASDIRRFFI